MEFPVAYASLPGFFRTVLILIGVFVLLKFIGQLMNAKRRVDVERNMMDQQKEFMRQREEARKHFGKTKIEKQNTSTNRETEDVDFEEM